MLGPPRTEQRADRLKGRSAIPDSIQRPRASTTQTLGLVARRLRLTKPAFRVLERYKALRAPKRARPAADNLPLPPALLRVQVSGDPDVDDFLESGKLGAGVISEAIGRHVPGGMEALHSVLDFGCGCGRIARHWTALDGPELHGCDYNPALVDWCRENLPFLQVERTDLSPPLPYASGRFDFVYALSVFTHLSERMQHEWMDELGRSIRSGGLLLFTTKGDSHAQELNKPGREGFADYQAGRFVVTDESVEGLNLCAAYHPYPWVIREMLNGFELLEFLPQGATMCGGQDLYLVRRV